tara:strand:+ start:131 stop:370 length:240 start_codon:yes stop_codon:yes gene_type:complete
LGGVKATLFFTGEKMPYHEEDDKKKPKKKKPMKMAHSKKPKKMAHGDDKKPKKPMKGLGMGKKPKQVSKSKFSGFLRGK